MRVLSVDPGYDRVGLAVLEMQNRESVLYSSCIETDKKAEMSDRLCFIGKEFTSIIKLYKPDVIAIEKIFFNKNIKTAIAVAQARGTLIYIGKKAGCRIYEFGPQEIKIAVTGYGASSKNDVRDMIIRLVSNVPKKALDDEYDAIAVGVTCLAHYRRNI